MIKLSLNFMSDFVPIGLKIYTSTLGEEICIHRLAKINVKEGEVVLEIGFGPDMVFKLWHAMQVIQERSMNLIYHRGCTILSKMV